MEEMKIAKAYLRYVRIAPRMPLGARSITY